MTAQGEGLTRAQTISRHGWAAIYPDHDAERSAKRREKAKAAYWEEREKPSFIRKMLRKGAIQRIQMGEDQ